MSQVELRGVSLAYGSLQAVRGLDLVAPVGALTACWGAQQALVAFAGDRASLSDSDVSVSLTQSVRPT